jgi:hypothetical protein
VLFERAKQLHPDKEFGADYPSRFHPGRGVSGGAKDATAAAPATAAPVAAAGQQDVASLPAPAAGNLADFEIPVCCRTCDGEFAVAFRFFQPGLVLRCPHCGYNFTPGQRVFLAVNARLDAFAEQVSARVDDCNAALEAAQIELEDSAAELRDNAVKDIRALVLERTEARKAGLFG